MKLLKRLIFIFTYGPEIDEVMVERRKANEEAERKKRQHHLQLCVKHQPVSPGSHYAEHNCDHCKLLAKLNEEALL